MKSKAVVLVGYCNNIMKMHINTLKNIMMQKWSSTIDTFLRILNRHSRGKKTVTISTMPMLSETGHLSRFLCLQYSFTVLLEKNGLFYTINTNLIILNTV